MSKDEGMRGEGGRDWLPTVMMLPLAVPEEDGFGDVDAGVLARRIPDFVHRILNNGGGGPTGMLEVQTPPEEGPVLWVVMDEPPDPEEAFDLLPEDAAARAVVTGEVVPTADGFRVEFHVYFAEDSDERFTSKVGGVLRRDRPVADLMQLTRRLARILAVPFSEPGRGMLTENGEAFFLFLRALDNAMLLSGDLQIEAPADCEGLLEPFAEAIMLDPGFGLALRVAQTTVAYAVDDGRIDPEAARRFLDSCYSAQPSDGEGCVAVADHLRELGDDERALLWLEHATHLDPPPSRGLESLGILRAHNGETVQARDLWLKGLQVDGHPDFFGHLARLAFSEERELDAWDFVVRGLRRLRERTGRAAEWDDQERGAGVLPMYLSEHLDDHRPGPDVIECLLDLEGMLDGDAQVFLALCLIACDEPEAARRELKAALLADTLSPDARDHACRAMLGIDVPDFDRRFARAVENATRGKRLRETVEEFVQFQRLQPAFWPALYYEGVAWHGLGQTDHALDVLDVARRLSPEQPDILHRMALCFDDRGNPKRALELVDEALILRADSAEFLGARARFLVALGRPEDARASVSIGLQFDPSDRELLRLQKKLDDQG